MGDILSHIPTTAVISEGTHSFEIVIPTLIFHWIPLHHSHVEYVGYPFQPGNKLYGYQFMNQEKKYVVSFISLKKE